MVTQGIRPWRLRNRLLVAMMVGMLIALSVTGAVLSRLFEQELEQQIRSELLRYLDRVTAQVNLSPSGPATVNTQGLTDPRWHQPYSGLYWQLSANDGSTELRSRSMWDQHLRISIEDPQSSELLLSQVPGPQSQQLMALSRTLHLPDAPKQSWTLSVALDHAELHSATQSFNATLVLALGLLFALMLALGGLQLFMGLSPLDALQRGLQRLKNGESDHLEGHYPAELQPLVDDFNQALKQQSDSALLAREQAGNLAHGVKTPLSVMQQAAQSHPNHPLAMTVQDQVTQAKRQIDWHLAKSRAAAAHHQIHEVNAVTPLIERLIHAMTVVHAQRALTIHWQQPPLNLAFMGTAQDFQEMLGNLLDNACQWAKTAVWVSLNQQGTNRLALHIDDDGNGLSQAEIKQVTQRGTRMDERQPGSGLGLAITQDLAITYGGQLELSHSPHGGLRASLILPAGTVD